MKIYVAKFYDVECESKPLKAFVSKEAAEAYCLKMNTKLVKWWNEEYLPEGEESMTYEEYVEEIAEDYWGVEEVELKE